MTSPPEGGIRRTVIQYAQLLDDGRFAEWEGLFTEDARLHVMGRTHTGREAVRRFIEAAQPPERRGKHLITGPLVAVDDGAGRARAWSDYVFVARVQGGASAITSVGRYHDELEQGADGRWRFSLREIVFQGETPAHTEPPPG